MIGNRFQCIVGAKDDVEYAAESTPHRSTHSSESELSRWIGIVEDNVEDMNPAHGTLWSIGGLHLFSDLHKNDSDASPHGEGMVRIVIRVLCP